MAHVLAKKVAVGEGFAAASPALQGDATADEHNVAPDKEPTSPANCPDWSRTLRTGLSEAELSFGYRCSTVALGALTACAIAASWGVWPWAGAA